MTTIKTLGYTFLAMAMAMAITGCKAKVEEAVPAEKPAAVEKTTEAKVEVAKPAVEAATVAAKPAEAKVEEAKPAAPAKGEKPLDHPAH
jgi:copper chaperone CopZ